MHVVVIMMNHLRARDSLSGDKKKKQICLLITGPVVTVPHAVTYAREGTAYYQLKHRAQLHTVASTQLKW